MNMSYPLLVRMLERCKEIRNEPNVHSVAALVYDAIMVTVTAAFLAAHASLKDAEDAAKKEGHEADGALERIHQPYAVARSASQALTHEISVPAALTSLPTDTDKKNAIQSLFDTLTRRAATEEWAQTLLAQPFGTLAPEVIREINEKILSEASVAKARKDRATAFGPAYEALIDFKAVVHDAYGSTSPQYRRLNVRDIEDDEEENGGGGGGDGGV